jgi:small subunit ribosomal protein S21
LTLPFKNVGYPFLNLRELPVQLSPAPREEVSSLTEIKLKKGEPVERALRRLKKKVDREGTLKTVRANRRFEKPSEKRRRKEKVARFSAMLTARHADD